MVRAKLRERGQITLPAEVRTALHIAEGDEVHFEVTEHGVLMRGLTMVPTDQAWFWTKTWLGGEARADDDISQGRVTTYENADDFLDGLDT